MSYQYITYDLRDSVGTITLNRPDKLNALNDALMSEIDDVMGKQETSLDLKVLVFKGAGRCFSAGQDLSGEGTEALVPPLPRASAPARELVEAERRRNRRWEYIFNYPKPVIAQVHGHCLGAGCYLAMVADLVIASEEAVFGDPSLRMGLPSAFPLWSWFIGVKKAREVIYLGANLSATEAEHFGLINLAVPRDQLDATVDRYARAISLPAGDGLAMLKESLNCNLESRGAGAAWRFLTEMQVMGQLRDREPQEFDFAAARQRQGVKAAIQERDRPFKALGF